MMMRCSSYLRKSVRLNCFLYSSKYQMGMIRSFSSVNWGFESSPIGESVDERALVERSCRRGCSAIITRTSPHSTTIHELLADLEGSQEIDIKGLFLGHIAQSTEGKSTKRNPEDIIDEVAKINKTLPKSKSLQFVTLNGCVEDENYIQRVYQLLRALPTNNPSPILLGVDLDTKFLMNLGKESEAMATLLRRLDTLYANNGGVLTIAANYFTHDCIPPIVAHAKDSLKVKVIATEVLQARPSPPGVGLLAATYDFRPAHIFERSPRGSKENKVGSVAYRERLLNVLMAVEDFKMAMDRCVHMEKGFIKKMSEMSDRSGLPTMASMCLGHVLMNTHTRYNFPEEFMSTYRDKILPAFTAGEKLLRQSGDKESKNWVTVYRVMAMYLSKAFIHYLQENNLFMSQEILDAMIIERNGSDSAVSKKGGDLSSLLPLEMSLLGTALSNNGEWNRFDYIALMQTQIDQVAWNRLLEEKSIQPLPDISRSQALTSIREILDRHKEE